MSLFLCLGWYLCVLENHSSAELQGAVNSSNMDGNGSNYISQEIELDAFAFTKYYLEKFENMKVRIKIDGLDNVIDKYIIVNSHLF